MPASGGGGGGMTRSLRQDVRDGYRRRQRSSRVDGQIMDAAAGERLVGMPMYAVKVKRIGELPDV